MMSAKCFFFCDQGGQASYTEDKAPDQSAQRLHLRSGQRQTPVSGQPVFKIGGTVFGGILIEQSLWIGQWNRHSPLCIGPSGSASR